MILYSFPTQQIPLIILSARHLSILLGSLSTFRILASCNGKERVKQNVINRGRQGRAIVYVG